MEAALAAKESEQDAQVRAVWEDLARQARGVHCPAHFVEPWRVHVIGTPPRLKLDIAGCCPRIGQAINEMIAADPDFRATR
jgi:hypothetical protein